MSDDELGLPPTLRESLRAWNGQYQAIIQMSPEQRGQPGTRLEIDRLDRLGLALVSQLTGHLPRGSKVSYFSEGLLRRRDRMD
ncbi:hypothetical protein [Kineosporia sp. NBRC 101677]|uniref:hypothetical protein n=1 Tax=Kineosporia sp. NBRC 101677 TaxID=3032197 RepID=UPI002556C632|nr:hypothetical protein [Kineosporia sp. NBRC 101677]